MGTGDHNAGGGGGDLAIDVASDSEKSSNILSPFMFCYRETGVKHRRA